MDILICNRFIEMIQIQDYYEAHEVLEEVWFPLRASKEPEVLLIKGFINASVAFELIKRGRPKPASTAWNTYLKYRPMLENLTCERVPVYMQIADLLETTKNELFK